MGAASLHPIERPLIYRLPRETIEALVERLIEFLDWQDGDPDLEANGDELDGLLEEDGFQNNHRHIGALAGAGCPYSDGDEDDDPKEWTFHTAPKAAYGIDQTDRAANQPPTLN